MPILYRWIWAILWAFRRMFLAHSQHNFLRCFFQDFLIDLRKAQNMINWNHHRAKLSGSIQPTDSIRSIATSNRGRKQSISFGFDSCTVLNQLLRGGGRGLWRSNYILLLQRGTGSQTRYTLCIYLQGTQYTIPRPLEWLSCNSETSGKFMWKSIPL